MTSQISLMNHFLIAMPAMANSYFEHTVSYICNHDETGAMGFIINRPVGIAIRDLLDQADIKSGKDTSKYGNPVYFGGPVECERGFVLHSGKAQWATSMPVTEELAITTSLDILEAIGKDKGPDRFLVLLGYAGWGPRQLEDEMLENTWLSAPADMDIIFQPDCTRSWQQSAQIIGIDLQQISLQAGHA